MNLTQLRYFNTVAEYENISKAADNLHASQPAISKNILKLEEELGCELFTRNGKNIKLNSAGARFLQSSVDILSIIDTAKEDLNRMNDKTNRKIKIGLAANCKDLCRCVKEFEQQYPNAEFDINGNPDQQDTLDINNYDAIIYPKAAVYEKYRGYALYDESCFMAVNVNNPLSDELVFNLNDISGERVIFMRTKKSTEYTHTVLNALSIKPLHYCYTDVRDLHKQMIANNVSIGFVPESSADSYRDDRIRLVPIMDSRFSRQIFISFRKDKYLSPLALEFKDFMLKFYGVE